MKFIFNSPRTRAHPYDCRRAMWVCRLTGLRSFATHGDDVVSLSISFKWARRRWVCVVCACGWSYQFPVLSCPSICSHAGAVITHWTHCSSVVKLLRRLILHSWVSFLYFFFVVRQLLLFYLSCRDSSEVFANYILLFIITPRCVHTSLHFFPLVEPWRYSILFHFKSHY